jgi:hypothetical protein
VAMRVIKLKRGFKSNASFVERNNRPFVIAPQEDNGASFP